MHPSSYEAAQRQTLSGRALEREVFARITARLDQTRRTEDRPAARADALEQNRRLWCTLAIDLASPSNACPDELKASLLSLAAFVESHTGRVIAGEGTPDILITINRNILQGLAAPAAKAA